MEALGYRRFATQGADWGSFISAELGHRFADHIIGVHTQLLAPLGLFGGSEPAPDLGELSEGEQRFLPRTLAFYADGMGYSQIQSTKPQTPAIALADSPVGLLAWLVEKRFGWSDSGGDLYRRFSRTDLIDSAMIYWITNTFGTSARYYYEARHRPWKPAHDRWPRVEAPTGVAHFPMEIVHQPRSWAERYYNVQRWTEMPAGGHFGAMEEPDALVADIRAFFRDLD
jgi:pimeloyl-ACP methyl ester carboxylesterase